jgi:hypothetical protein
MKTTAILRRTFDPLLSRLLAGQDPLATNGQL